MSRCPICKVKIPEHKLMCWPHWDKVPEDLQKKVLALWRVHLRSANPSIRRLALEEYRKAREETIAAVKSQMEKQHG